MIQFENVTKRYPGGIEALCDISFSIDRGEMVVLSGHSGAGKSSLLRLIAAIEQPTSGSIIIGKQKLNALRRSGLAVLRQNLGLIFQDRKLLFDRSLFDNVMLPLSIAGFPHKDATRRVRAALDKVGLLAREKSLPITLSGGEQQRLSIARAIVNRPAILIADEPTAHLDKAYAKDIAELFHSFNQVGVTVLVATPDEALFSPFAGRRLILSQGKLHA